MKTRPPKQSRRKSWDLPAAAYEILKRSGQPLGLRDLKQAMEALSDGKLQTTLSILHTELNLDGRFVFTPQSLWALKSQVDYRLRGTDDDFDITEGSYQPHKGDYKTAETDDEDLTDDEAELLVPFSEEEVLDDEDDSQLLVEADELIQNNIIDAEDLEDDEEESEEEPEEDFPL